MVQACGREDECISTYKVLEDTHPVPRVRRQAANLRYIIEAPKMELGADERVQIPALGEVERKKCAPQSDLKYIIRLISSHMPRVLSTTRVVSRAQGRRA